MCFICCYVVIRGPSFGDQSALYFNTKCTRIRELWSSNFSECLDSAKKREKGKKEEEWLIITLIKEVRKAMPPLRRTFILKCGHEVNWLINRKLLRDRNSSNHNLGSGVRTWIILWTNFFLGKLSRINWEVMSYKVIWCWKQAGWMVDGSSLPQSSIYFFSKHAILD